VKNNIAFISAYSLLALKKIKGRPIGKRPLEFVAQLLLALPLLLALQKFVLGLLDAYIQKITQIYIKVLEN